MMAEVYVCWPGELDDLVEVLRPELNFPERNIGPGSNPQRREGISWGGEYWLFETLGYELRVVHNRGDTFSEERSDYPFYISIKGANQETSLALARHLEAVLQRAGLDVVADSLQW